MEGVNFDYLSDVWSPTVTPCGRGCPAKVANNRTNVRIQRRCQEVTVMLGLADEERLELTATVRDQGRALVTFSSSQREMDGLKIEAAALEEKNAAEKLLEAQEQVDAAMEEASIARDFLRDVILNNATEIAEDATNTTEMMEGTKKTWSKMKKFCATKLFQHLNSFCKGRGKWVQHAKDILNMAPLRCLLIGFVMVLLRETLFTKKKWAQAVDMNHGLDLGGIEVIQSREGTKKGAMGLVWSSSTVKDFHRAAEREMQTKVLFKLIKERREDMWIDGVQLDVHYTVYLIRI
jgi:hypothetical protein